MSPSSTPDKEPSGACGSLVETRFPPDFLPDVLTELTVSDDARRRAVTDQVVQRLGDGVVRCVAMAPAEGLGPGMKVMSSGRRPETLVSREVLARAVNALGVPRRDAFCPIEVIETGIKVIERSSVPMSWCSRSTGAGARDVQTGAGDRDGLRRPGEGMCAHGLGQCTLHAS